MVVIMKVTLIKYSSAETLKEELSSLLENKTNVQIIPVSGSEIVVLTD